MIRLSRIRTASAIPRSFHGPGRTKTETKLLQTRRDHLVRLQSNPKAAHNFPSSWWKAAKPTLRRESGGKCAYCEARADAVAHCDVEHFRPKSEWWWLTCCWENYCFACQICNQTYKGDEFPISGRRTDGPLLRANSSESALMKLAGNLAPDPLDEKSVQGFSKRMAAEDADLPDPYLDSPEDLFAWEVDKINGQIKIVARTNTRRAKRALAAAEEYFGLNREELRDFRYQLYETLEKTHQALAVPNLPIAARDPLLQLFRPYLDGTHQFTAMCRYFICDVWRHLPRPP